MPWVKLDDQFTEHPKILSLGAYAPLCGWLHLCAISWCNRHLTDGFVPQGVATRLTHFDNLTFHVDGHVTPRDIVIQENLIERLVAQRLWHVVDGGYQIHDYLDYQPSRAESEELKGVRAQAGKSGAAARWHGKNGKPHGNTIATCHPGDGKHGKPIANGMAKSCPDPDPVKDSTRTAASPLSPVENSVENYRRHRDPEDAPFRTVCALVRGALKDYHPHDEADLMGELKDRCAKAGFLYSSDLLVRALNFERGKATHARRTA